MCSSTYMAFSQNTSHPVGRSPLWLFARTFLNFCHFEGVRMALGQTWFAHMQEPFTRIPNLVLTQKSHLAPTSVFPRTQQIWQKIFCHRKMFARRIEMFKYLVFLTHVRTKGPWWSMGGWLVEEYLWILTSCKRVNSNSSLVLCTTLCSPVFNG